MRTKRSSNRPPERFEQQVAKYPDRIAVKTKADALTFAELNQAANRVAHAILDQSELRRPDRSKPFGLKRTTGELVIDEKDDTTTYKVVVNHEEQYSIWPADKENALGWKDAGKSETKAECLAYIKEVWTDMRLLSLRKKMAEARKDS